MALPIVIAKNQTVSDIFLGRLGLTVPASGQITLTGGVDPLATFGEVSNDESLVGAVTSGAIAINDGVGDLSTAEALAYLDATGNMDGPVTGAATHHLIKLSDSTGRRTETTSVTVDSLGCMDLGSGDLSTTGTVNASSLEVGGNPLAHTDLANLAWGLSDHTGTGDTLAAFTAGGAATNLSINASGDISGAWPILAVNDLTITGAVKGAILYFNGSNWTPLPPGVSGQILQTLGSGANPEWWAYPTSVLVDYYASAAYTSVSTTASTVPFDTTRQSDATFTLASNEVTCNTAGDYRVDFDFALSGSVDVDISVDVWLEIDGTEVEGTRSRALQDSYENVQSACHSMALLTLAANEVLRVRCQVVAGTNTVATLADSVRLLIHSIGANGRDGATGPQGPAGSGSTVNVQEEGTNLPNTPHSTINFTGPGVTTSDAGSGVATVNVPFSPNILQVIRATSQTINTSDTVISWSSSQFEDSYYTWSGDNITIETSGVYKVGYSVFFDTNANSRRTLDVWVENDPGTGFAEIIPSRSSDYARNSTDDTGSATAAFFYEFTKNDVLRLVGRSSGTSGTLLAVGNRIWMGLEFVRAT